MRGRCHETGQVVPQGDRYMLPRVILGINNKEYIILEKDGIPIAALMDINRFEDCLELQDPEVKRHIAASTKEYLEGKASPQKTLLPNFRRRGKRKSAGGNVYRHSLFVPPLVSKGFTTPFKKSCL